MCIYSCITELPTFGVNVTTEANCLLEDMDEFEVDVKARYNNLCVQIIQTITLLSSPELMLRVSYCDRSQSVVHCPVSGVHPFTFSK